MNPKPSVSFLVRVTSYSDPEDDDGIVDNGRSAFSDCRRTPSESLSLEKKTAAQFATNSDILLYRAVAKRSASH